MAIRKKHSPQFKAKVALEAIKDLKPLNEIASEYNIHPVQVSKWKKDLLENLSSVFTVKKKDCEPNRKIDELYRQIGEITVERDWLKKKLKVFS
jgi:transposase-like protein